MKKTNAEFLLELEIKNKYAYNNLEFIDEYNGDSIKIIAMSRHGLVRVSPSSLLQGKFIDIRSAINKHTFFLSMLHNQNRRALELLFITKCTTLTGKILVANSYGIMSIVARKLVAGVMPDIRSAIDKTSFFINNAIDIHGNKYDYSKVDYVGSNECVTIICHEHGEFQQLPGGHLSGRGCAHCGNERSRKARLRFTNMKEFIDELKIKNNWAYENLEFISEYTDIISKLLTVTKFGNIWTTPRDLLDGKIPTIEVAINKTEFWINEMKFERGLQYKYEKVNYINAKTDVVMICHEHGDFNINPNNFKSGKGCNKCAMEITRKKLAKTPENFEKEVYGKFKDEILIKGRYLNSSSKILVSDKYGDLEVYAGHLLRGVKPTIQSAVDTKSYITNMFREVHGDMYGYDKVQYINSHVNVIITCEKHGDFLQQPSNHLLGNRCPSCGSSKGEDAVAKFLISNGITFTSEYKMNDVAKMKRFRFDFYLNEIGIIIEYDGIGHFEPVDFAGKGTEWAEDQMNRTQINDGIKNKYCQENNIKLIRIPYWDFKNIEEILIREVLNHA